MLRRLGVIDKDSTEAIYNGGSMEGYPMRMEPLVELRAWKPFVQHPAIHAFFRRAFAEEPFWIPTCEYRATPPNGDRTRNRFDYPHQDGFYNQGFRFAICWIPLARIDATIGGLAMTEVCTGRRACMMFRNRCCSRSRPASFPRTRGNVRTTKPGTS